MFTFFCKCPNSKGYKEQFKTIFTVNEHEKFNTTGFPVLFRCF